MDKNPNRRPRPIAVNPSGVAAFGQRRQLCFPAAKDLITTWSAPASRCWLSAFLYCGRRPERRRVIHELACL